MCAPERNSGHLETIVRWYLRFNGFLGVENFIVHEPLGGRVPQVAETDVLAVRFPYSTESPGFLLVNDNALLDPEAVADHLIDFVIAEVKGGTHRAGLNSLWRSPASPQKTARVEYILRWLGALPAGPSLAEVADQLQRSHRVRVGGHLFRVVYFGRRRHPTLEGTDVCQITFADIARFIVGTRASCWATRALGSRSAHDQWDPIVRHLWRLAEPEDGSGDEDERVKRVLAAMGVGA